MRQGWLFPALFILLLLTCPFQASAEPGKGAEGTKKEYKVGDPELDVIWVDEQNGKYLPLDRTFQDETGNSVQLKDIIDKPTLLLPVYFHCPNSCTLNLSHLADAVNRSNFTPGKDFNLIALSFNDGDTPAKAKAAKENYLPLLPKSFPQESWKFLTGSKEDILALTNAIGYRFEQRNDGTFIHPSAVVAVAADGMIIKYVYGNFISGDVDMAISEAQQGIPALSVRRFLDYCFNYAPEKTRAFFTNIKLFVVLGFVCAGGLFFLWLRRKDKKKWEEEEAVHDEHHQTGNKV
ncbi:MAG: SCO family protein [Candidatus Electrothrix scaldis]|nr:MAG: SCO family protein [Candidatus Electrothrix sp. GW3-3]